MTNGVKELDMPKEFKSVAEQLKAMYNALKKWPFMMGITILMFVLLISSEYLTDNEFILFLQIIGFAEYSCAVTPQVRQTGNRLSGLAGTAYASLLA